MWLKRQFGLKKQKYLNFVYFLFPSHSFWTFHATVPLWVNKLLLVKDELQLPNAISKEKWKIMKNYCCTLRIRLKNLDKRFWFLSKAYHLNHQNNGPPATERRSHKLHCMTDLAFLMNSIVIVCLGFPQESPISFAELKENVLVLLISCLKINEINCNDEKRMNCERQEF